MAILGMEAAAYLISKECSKSVTVVGNSSVPFERSLGVAVGTRLMKFFENKGIQFRNSAGVAKIHGIEGKVSKVKLYIE